MLPVYGVLCYLCVVLLVHGMLCYLYVVLPVYGMLCYRYVVLPIIMTTSQTEQNQTFQCLTFIAWLTEIIKKLFYHMMLLDPSVMLTITYFFALHMYNII